MIHENIEEAAKALLPIDYMKPPKRMSDINEEEKRNSEERRNRYEEKEDIPFEESPFNISFKTVE